MSATSVQRTEHALSTIPQAGAQGQHIFTRLYPEAALAAARAADARAQQGMRLGPLDGKLVSIKDLFDVAGEATTAGSAVRRSAAPAVQDAEIVQRLRAAGAVIIGKTNMTEFAFSGIGINPHYGTPGNAHDAAHIPGGSSSGAGVAVALGMCDVAIGSDTGGSIRIPAALNGVTGFKASQQRVSRNGAFPLSWSLDTVGPLARDVLTCAQADSVLSGQTLPALQPWPLQHLRVAVPRGLLFTQTSDAVLTAFETALQRLRDAGAWIADVNWEAWMQAPFQLQEQGTLIAAEAAHIHQDLLASDATAQLDPLVLSRLQRGQRMLAPQYAGVQHARGQWQATLDAQMQPWDMLLLPTVPQQAPRIDALENADAFHHTNMLMLRNTSVFNFYDLPALSLPLPGTGLPIGMMLVARRGQDAALLAMAHAVEQQLQR